MRIKLSLLAVFIFISFASFAQNYKEQITKHREAYKADFIKETRSPLKEADLQYLHFFDADSTYKISAAVEILKNEKVFNMPTYDGTSKEFIRYAQITFMLKGKKLKMTLYRNISLLTNPTYKDLLFLPFTDESNNKTTYGGGRYIDLSLNDIKDGFVEVDFNKAYNPYCAYSDGYRCPVPPEENDLAIAILAGEKSYTGTKKHK
ncbi:DUF1684 domain-containing protein [Pedobacter sp. LMG 31464]|uniref:DUF1684 domain-containing protein n=1 Tax=Pedobacter planticolens TaxID=2679964 RepID=A0A923ITY4_9SPHI|nr:DUF1684 domain-containing protein [Pedobacter planticolens]MBB2145290.1 DUF1684 domain-containing protein [Pedobacter planticolens]